MQRDVEVDGGWESGEVHTGVVMVKDEEGLWCGWCGCDETHPCPFLVLRAEGGTANCTGLADILLSLTHKAHYRLLQVHLLQRGSGRAVQGPKGRRTGRTS